MVGKAKNETTPKVTGIVLRGIKLATTRAELTDEFYNVQVVLKMSDGSGVVAKIMPNHFNQGVGGELSRQRIVKDVGKYLRRNKKD